MSNKRKKETYFYLGLMIVGLLALTIALAAQPALADILPQSAYQRLQAAWLRVGASPQYDYHSTILQTTIPTAKLANAGRSSQTQHTRIDGSVDKAADAMQMQLQVGQQAPLAVKFEDGQAYGRQGSGEEWVELESTPDLFAPGGDPLGFLVAMENVRQLGVHEKGMDDFSAPAELLNTAYGDEHSFTRYAFDLSGPKFAHFMKEQMEAELRRKGELPPSMSLSMASHYVAMTGHGEIWVNADGLPERQLIYIDFPAEAGADGQVSANISTSFVGWAKQPAGGWSLLWRDPTLILNQPATVTGISAQTAQQAGMALGLMLFILGLIAFALLHRRRLAVRATVYSLIILSMVITPLLQTQQASAFYDAQQARSSKASPATAETVETNTFNPHENPVQVAMVNTAAQPAVQEAAFAAPASSVATAQAAAECIVTASSDCDGDGLSDQIEIHQLGTFVNSVDTDGDLISDNAEVQPFTMGGQTWYLDPRSIDSNGDGLADALECSDRIDVGLTTYVASDAYAACADTDGDGIPDVYDFDNDGDGVPDNADSAPNKFQSITDGKFGFALKGYEADRSLFVNVAIRPSDDRHLWWANNVLDWPSNDTQGQVQRVTDDEMQGGGDMRLTPLLEVAIPYDAANPTRSLPVLAGVNAGAVGKNTPLSDWLDQDRLASYGIVVSGPRAADGLLYLYVPMTIIEDQVGQTPVGFGATLLYEMAGNASSWGADHEMRLLWTVNGLVDSCDANAAIDNGLPASAADTYCNDYANWTNQSSMLQAYYDDFSVTSLTVQEQRGASALIVAQNAGNEAYESDLWHLADTLHDTYLEAETVNGQRLALSQIPDHLSAWGIANGALSIQPFTGLHDQTDLAEALTGDEILTALSTSHPSASEYDTANLLFVAEETMVSANLATTGTTFAAGTIAMDLSSIDAQTTGAVRWKPYEYKNGVWTEQNVASYAEQLATNLGLVLTKDALVNAGLATAADDADLVSSGAALLAANYYLTVYTGGMATVDKGALALVSEPLVAADHVKPAQPVVTIVARLVAGVQSMFAQLSLSNLEIESSGIALQQVSNKTWANLAASPSAILTAMGQLAAGDISSSALLALQQMVNPPAPQSLSGSQMLDAMVRVFTGYSLALQTGNTGVDTIPGDLRAGLYFARLGRAIYQFQQAYEMAETLQELREAAYARNIAAYGAGTPEFEEAYASSLQSFAKAENATRWVANQKSVLMAKFGLALELALIGFSFTYTVITQHVAADSPAFNQLAAHAIAQAILAVLTYLITVAAAATPGVNVLLAIVLLVDAIVSIVCAAQNRDDWWCGGVSGLVAEAITYAINDTTLLMDLEREDQFDVAFDAPKIKAIDKVNGLAVGNTLTLSATITSNAYTGQPNWMGYVWNWQLSDENVMASAVDFRLQNSQTDFDSGLSFGDTAWKRPSHYTTNDYNPQPGKRFEADFQRTVDYTLDKAGVNVGLSGVYLSEAVRVKKQDCWLGPNPLVVPPVIPYCGTDEVFDDTFHQSLEDIFVLDVFPATLDDFHALAQNVNGQPAGAPWARLAWDDTFPVLQDADGDGLISAAFNGPDPDDSNPDTDGDGLSDFYEVQNGFDPTEADVDCDGLTDYWEAFYHTNPKSGDSDYDGLPDSREVLHPNTRYPYEHSVFSNTTAPVCAGDVGMTGGYAGGWDMVYAFNGDTPLHFWVSADPNDPDTDDDGLTDRSEQVYGYSPHAPSELDVLALETTVSTSSDFGAYVGADATIDYEATITNDLNDRYLRGLLESELPVDSVISTREIDLLKPLASSTLAGTVAVADAGITASTATSLTLRSGAFVDDAVDNGQTYWLHMNEPAGATTFADASLNGNDVSCTTCPSANGSTLSFTSGSQPLTLARDAINVDAFSVGAWVRQVSDTGFFRPFKIGNRSNGNYFQLDWSSTAEKTVLLSELSANGDYDSVFTEFNNWPGQWRHVMVTYDRSAKALKLYLNGSLVASITDAVEFPTDTSSLDILVGELGDDGAFEMDEFEFHPRVLDAQTIRNRYDAAPLQFDLTGAGNGISCPNGRCPIMNDAGAAFFQGQHLAVDTSSLNFSDNQFSFAVDIKPQTRPHPFNNTAASYFGKESDQDWQGVFGYEDPANSSLIFPSLFVGGNGALRMVMGDGSNSCQYTTADGIVDMGSEQHVVVSFDGSAFTVYIDGVERTTGAPTSCANVQVPNVSTLYVGRPNNFGYLYFDHVWFDKITEPTAFAGDAEVRVNFNGDGSSSNIWSQDVPTADENPPSSQAAISIGRRLIGDANSSRFRLWEDDSSPNNNDYNNSVDDNILEVTGITNISPLATNSTSFDSSDGDGAKGILYWNLSNEFFVGALRNLRIYDRALSPLGAARAYNTDTFSLQMDFDEAPGETVIGDQSGNYFEAGCSGATCPDSGIPGRINQVLRFDGGKADDDAPNGIPDGVADYLTLAAGEAGLGLEGHNFTIMAWVKPDAVDGIRRILAAGRAQSVNGVGFGVDDGNLLFSAFGVTDFRSTNANIPTGKWSHVAVSFDVNNNAHFYVNGQFIETVPGLPPLPAGANSDDAYRIGATTDANSTATAEVWDGLIDDVRILKFAADASTIQRMMDEAPLLNLHLDEDIDTTTFVDDSLNAAVATCSGSACPGAGDKGQVRESATFDGNNLLTVNGGSALDLTDFSIALWVKPTHTTGHAQWLIKKDDANGYERNYGLRLNPDSTQLRFVFQDHSCPQSAGQWKFFDSTGSLLLNQWNHVVATYDNAANHMALYLNGTLDSTYDPNLTGVCTKTHPVKFGESFVGNLDEATIDGGVLTAEQVAALYNYQSAWFDKKQQHTILVDADNPVSSLVLGSDYIQPGTVLFINAEDPVVNGVAAGLDHVDYNIDGGGWTEATEENGNYFVPASATAGLSEGSHAIQVRATDNIGHSTEGVGVTAQVDATPPTVAVRSDPLLHGLPSNITVVRDGTFGWFGNAADDHGSVQSGLDEGTLQVTVQDRRGNVVDGPVGATLNNGGWASTHHLDFAPYGIYTVTAKASDLAGNEASANGIVALDGLPGYGDLLIDSNIITGTGTVISGLASDIPYPQKGKTLHLHFEEQSGATMFYDGSANHFNGACTGANCPTLEDTDKFDRAARFDGNDFVVIGDQAGVTAAQAMGLNGSFTIMAWVKPAALSGAQQILAAQQISSAGGIGFGLDGNRLLLRAFGAQDYASTVASGITADAWNHVAAKYDATTKAVTFYVNGELLETVAGDNELVVNTDDAYRIGEGFSGFIDEVAVYSMDLSAAEIYNIANPIWDFPGMVRVRYRHASGAVWPQLDPDGLALYLPLDEVVGSDAFADLSIYGRDAACSGAACPVAGGVGNDNKLTEPGFHPPGGWGNAVAFDGVDDYLSAPHVLDPASTDFTGALWFKLEGSADNRPILLQQMDGSGSAGRTWFGIQKNGLPFTFLGGQALAHTTKVDDNAWHHAAVTFEHASQKLTLYIDSVAVSATRPMEASNGSMVIGADKSFSSNFGGGIDEVAIFDRALTATEIGYLQAEPWYLSFYDEDELVESPNIFRPWQHTVPDGLEGPYKIDLLVAENFTGYRAGVSHGVWTGEIDTTAPRVAMTYTLSADKSSVTISCAAADYNLSEDGWACPVDVANRSHHYKDAAWFTTTFSDTQKLAGFTTAEELFTPGPDLHVSACDTWGQCTTLTPEDTDGDGIPDYVEGEGDRDGDGILDAHDYDPDGHFYELGTGRIVPGGKVSISGPGPVQIDPDGSSGYYDWTTEGVPGLYEMTVTPPPGYVVSPDCPAQPGAITPSGVEPEILGSSEVSNTATLADGSCAGNPYYLQFNVIAGEPFVFNNNIPLTAQRIQGNEVFLPFIINVAGATLPPFPNDADPATGEADAAAGQTQSTPEATVAGENDASIIVDEAAAVQAQVSAEAGAAAENAATTTEVDAGEAPDNSASPAHADGATSGEGASEAVTEQPQQPADGQQHLVLLPLVESR